MKSEIKKLEAKVDASTLTEDENCELVKFEKKLSDANERLDILEKLLFTYSNQLFSLTSQSSSGVSEMTKVVQSGFKTQIQAAVPSELETANLFIGEEIAANYLAEALSYDLIDASHPLLKTREGCKASVKFKKYFASSDQCLSLCCNLVSRSAIYFQIIR